MGTKTIRIHFNNGGMLPMVSCEYRWKNCWGVGEKCATSQTRLWPRAEENDEQIALTSWCYTNLKYTNNTGCFNPTVPISPRFTVDSFCPVVYIDSEFETNKNTCSPCILAFCSHVMWCNWDILNIKKLDQCVTLVTSHRGENASAGQALTKSTNHHFPSHLVVVTLQFPG